MVNQQYGKGIHQLLSLFLLIFDSACRLYGPLAHLVHLVGCVDGAMGSLHLCICLVRITYHTIIMYYIFVSIDSHFNLSHLVYLIIVLNGTLSLSFHMSVHLVAMAHLVCFSKVLNGAI